MKQLQTISLNGGNNPTASYPDVTASLGDFLSHFTHRKLFWNSSSWQQNYRKPALTFPRSLHFATSFPSPFLGLFYSLLSPCSGFHCGFFGACEVLHAKPGAAPRLSLCRVGAPQSHAHTHILHNLKPNSTLRLFSPLQFSSQLFSFLFLPRSLCLCWRRSLRCHPAPLCSQHFTRSVILNILRKVFCHFKQENIKKLIIFLGEEAKFWHPGELSWPSPPYFVSPSLVLCWIKYLEGEKEKTSPLVHP